MSPLEVKTINKQKFLSELSKLLTFMFEEDRLTALDLYAAAFDASADEEETAKQLVSPTRQAVVIARAYDVKARTRVLEAEADGVYPEDTPEFVAAINDVLHGVMQAAVPAPAETAQETAPQVKSSVPLDDLDAFINDMDSGVSEEYGQESSPADSADDVDSFLDELEEESSGEYVSKTVVWRLVLYLIFAIPIGLVLIVLVLLIAVLFFGLTAAAGALGVVSVSAAFGTGFAMISDILVVGGLAVLLLALGLLFLWCAIWFIVGAVPGIVRGVINLGRRLCVKEVSI